MERISIAGNIEAPIYKLLLNKGFEVEILNNNWVAKNQELEIIADSIFELAGIIMLRENKGRNWRVNDGEIDEYLDFLQKNNK